MAKSRFSGPKYANGDHKSQQKAYNKTKKGVKRDSSENKELQTKEKVNKKKAEKNKKQKK